MVHPVVVRINKNGSTRRMYTNCNSVLETFRDVRLGLHYYYFFNHYSLYTQYDFSDMPVVNDDADNNYKFLFGAFLLVSVVELIVK